MFDFITNFDFSQLLTWEAVFALVFGSVIGMLIGALPGLGSTIGIAICLPMTYNMDALPAILLLVSLYMSSNYGGSISAIVLGIPGQSAALATTFDGAPMAKGGNPGRALGISLWASTIGGFIGVFVLMLLTQPLSVLTTKLTDPELFVIAIFGLLSLTTMGTDNIPKTLLSIFLGLMIGTIGLDALNGAARYTFKQPILYDGLKLVPILTGLFAVSEVFNMVMQDTKIQYVTDTKNLKTHITREDRKLTRSSIWKSSIIGIVFGIIPGLGGNIASFFSYTEAKRTAKDPKTFGQGDPVGIAAPESSNNACVSGALIPYLTMGIPGSPSIAVISSALIMQGIQPGPTLMNEHASLVYGMYWGLLIATILMFIIGYYLTNIFSRLLVIPNYILAPMVLLIALIGAYCTRYQFFDVWIALLFGVIGFFINKLDYSVPAFALAFVLADLVESRFRRSLIISQGSYAIFFNRPVCIVIWLLLAAMIASRIYSGIKRKKSAGAEKTEEM